MEATIDVVVVLPWLPAMAMPNFRRMSSASSSPRGITGICKRRASADFWVGGVESRVTTTRFRSCHVRGLMAHVNAGAQFRQAVRDGARFEVGARDLIAESQQDLRDSAHPDAPDSHEVHVLGLKKHLLKVLFRLSCECQRRNAALLLSSLSGRLLENIGSAFGRAGFRKRANPLPHGGQRSG